MNRRLSRGADVTATSTAPSPPLSPQPSWPRYLYTVLLLLILLLIPLYLLWRARRDVRYLRGWLTRFVGIPPRSNHVNDDAPWLWLHAVSVGETHASLPLLQALQKHHWHRAVLTGMTPAGQAAAAQVIESMRKGSEVFQATHQLLPYDFPWCWRILFWRWRRRFGRLPSMLVLMETELWPNLLAACQRAGIPIVLANARVSPKTAAAWARWPRLSRMALSSLSQVIAQSELDAQRLSTAGAAVTATVGNLKFDVPMYPERLAQGQAWRQQCMTRFACTSILLLASSRDGEEAQLLSLWRELAHQPAWQAVRLMIVPRHPDRFAQVRESILQAGFQPVARSAGFEQSPEQVSTASEQVVLLGDSMGEMQSYYAAAHWVLMGGTWGDFGGQNFVEACGCGAAVLIGPSTYHFQQAADDALAEGAVEQCADLKQALSRLAMVLENDKKQLSEKNKLSENNQLIEKNKHDSLAQRQQRALAFYARHAGAAAATAALIAERVTV